MAATPPGPAPADGRPLDLETVRALWPDLIGKVGLRIGVHLSRATPAAIAGPDLLVIRVAASYNRFAEECEAPEARARIEQELRKLLDRPVTIRFERAGAADGDGLPSSGSASSAPSASAPRRPGDLESDPMVQKVVRLFEARPIHMEVEEEREPTG